MSCCIVEFARRHILQNGKLSDKEGFYCSYREGVSCKRNLRQFSQHLQSMKVKVWDPKQGMEPDTYFDYFRSKL